MPYRFKIFFFAALTISLIRRHNLSTRKNAAFGRRCDFRPGALPAFFPLPEKYVTVFMNAVLRDWQLQVG